MNKIYENTQDTGNLRFFHKKMNTIWLYNDTFSEIPHISSDKQNRPAWLSDAPSDPNTSPGASPAHHQTFLDRQSDV